MVMMATNSLPLEAIRRSMVSAVDLVIQVSRLHDGSRKVMNITEVVGIEGKNVVLEELFSFKALSHGPDGQIRGGYVTSGVMARSALFEKARFFGLEQQLSQTIEAIELAA